MPLWQPHSRELSPAFLLGPTRLAPILPLPHPSPQTPSPLQLRHTMQDFIHTYQELQVYQLAFDCSTEIFHLSRSFPKDETTLLTHQSLAASRSVCASIAEAWGKRRYRKAFVAKLSDAQAEAAEMQTWIQVAIRCGYLGGEVGQELFGRYGLIFAALDRLIENAAVWVKSSEGISQ